MKKIKLVKRGNQHYTLVKNLLLPEWYKEDSTAEHDDILKRSLSNKGFLQPITINMYEGRQGVILNGVQTVKACQALQIHDVPVFLVYVKPEEEGECHVLLNERNSLLTEEQKRALMKERFNYYFGDDAEILNQEASMYDVLHVDDDDIDTSAQMRIAAIKYEKTKNTPLKHIRKCTFNLPPEYRDYPERAMEAYGFESRSELFIQLLKYCVEGEENEAA